MSRGLTALAVAQGEDDKIAVATPESQIRPTTSSTKGILTPPTSESDTPDASKRLFTTFTSPLAVETTESDESDTDPEQSPKRRKKYRKLSHVVAPGPAYPRSEYYGWKPTCPLVSEADALRSLLQAHVTVSEDGFTYFELDDFCIYQPRASKYHPQELVTLDRLSQDRFAEYRFDGYLSDSNQRHYVQNVPFRVLTIDGYGEPNATNLGQQICLQSPQASRAEVWYKLGMPSSVYKRFYDPFLWLARFTKHFVDYLLEHSHHRNVTLLHFRKKFHIWLHEHYQGADFYNWLEVAKLKDFRTTVAAHVNFLYKECHSIDDAQTGLCCQPIWKEVGPSLTAIKEQKNKEKDTVVTPYAFDCFYGMYFGDKLVARQVYDPNVRRKIEKRKNALGLTPFRYTPQLSLPQGSHLPNRPDASAPNNIQVGDVVCVRPELSGRTWSTISQSWFAYVQGVRLRADRTLLDVLWIYEPCDTTIGKASYPFPNELFLSDNCDCGTYALDLECVMSKVNVSWFATNPYAQPGYFVRQKFRTVHDDDTYDFVTLCQHDFKCQCENRTPIFEECQSKYSIGDTVLVREWSQVLGEDRLEPAQIIGFNCTRKRVVLRRFLRKVEEDPTSAAQPNELQLTTEIFDKPSDKIIRKCHVRRFSAEQILSRDILTPYDRDGAGDFFYYAQDVETINKFPQIAQGWNPALAPPRRKLVGMGIFCGGGTFDRGLEEGGAVNFRYAVDWATPALHSYRANVDHPEKVQYFLGSVNDYLGRAMAGDPSILIAGPGDTDVISGGSPCPGFSLLQSNKLSEESKQNASMVASVVSFVDFYSPQKLILENVVTMTCGLGPNKDQNVFSQIIAALVGLGYQVQQFLIDAWSHGSSQQRSRVFIIASAPRLKPHTVPAHSHSHPYGLAQRALGKSSNGKRFGKRRDEYTAFQHVSARQAVQDLPYIGDSQPQLCPAFPDYRTARDESRVHRTRMAVIPTRPYGMGLMQAKLTHRPGLPDLLSGDPLEYCSRVRGVRSGPKAKMYARIYPEGLFPTIITRLAISDGINGQWVHWDQHRSLTVMETRRAQGYLDEEVIVGTPSEQLKIVGNSVDRKVALVLGLALRESWMESEQGAAGEEDDDTDNDDIDEVDMDANNDGSDGDEDPNELPFSPVAGSNRYRDEFDDDELDDEHKTAADHDGDDASAEPFTPPRALDDITANADSLSLDNRTAKIALHLSPSEIEEVRRDHFKAIRRILDARRA